MKGRLALLGLTVGGLLSAQAADIEQGHARSLACQACHGSAGVGTAPDIPNLAGQKGGYLQAQLVAFRSRDLAAFWSSLPAGVTADPHAADPAAEFRKSRMSFPAGFPRDFVMYHEVTDAANNSAKRSYANHAAVKAARAGQTLPAGSAIVVENLSAKDGVPGQINSYAAMESRAGWGDGVPEILRNGDWSYALFDGQQTLRADFNYARCLACHKPKADTSYLFGLDAIRK